MVKCLHKLFSIVCSVLLPTHLYIAYLKDFISFGRSLPQNTLTIKLFESFFKTIRKFNFKQKLYRTILILVHWHYYFYKLYNNTTTYAHKPQLNHSYLQTVNLKVAHPLTFKQRNRHRVPRHPLLSWRAGWHCRDQNPL